MSNTTKAERMARLEARITGTEPQGFGKATPGTISVFEFRPYELAEEFGLSPEDVCLVLNRVMGC